MGLEAAPLVNNGESSLGLEKEELQQWDHDEQVIEPDNQISVTMHMMTMMMMHILIWRMTAILWLLLGVAALILKKGMTTTEKCFIIFNFECPLMAYLEPSCSPL